METNLKPKSWSHKKLGEVVDRIEGGGTPSKKNATYWGGSIPWASVKDIVTHNKNGTQDYITKKGLENSSSRLVPKGTLIVPTRMALGHAVTFEVDVAINQDLKALYPTQKLDNKFLYYWFQSKRKYIEKLGSGSTVTGIQLGELKSLDFLLPEIPEQKRIIAVLEIWDRVVEKLKRKIEIKKEVKKGLMQELLTGKRRAKGFADKWTSFEISSFCEISRGGSPRPIQDYMTEDKDGLNWLKIGDVPKGSRYITNTTGKIKKEGLKKTTVVNNGDFILSNSMSFGRPYIMKLSACIHDGWLALKNISPKVNKDFLYYLLSSEIIQAKFRSISAGSGVLNLKKETVAEVVVHLPSLEEQNLIAKVLGNADDEIDELNKKLILISDQKKYLLNKLVTGEIRTPETLSIPK